MTRTLTRSLIALAAVAIIALPVSGAQAATVRIQYSNGKPTVVRSTSTYKTKLTPAPTVKPTVVPVKATPAVVKTTPVVTTKTTTPVKPTTTRTASLIIPIKGDVTQDGIVNQADVTLLAQMSIGAVAPDLGRGDMNGDGEILNNDVVIVSNMVKSIPQTSTLKGDVNKNGKIDQIDLVKIAYMAGGIIPADIATADLDGDGFVMVNDVVLADRNFKGDVTQDGVINRDDLLQVLQMAAGARQANVALADMDSDGVVAVNDVVLLQKEFKGDLNQDGILTQEDIDLMARMEIGILPLNLQLADMDSDGQLLVNDMLILDQLIKMKKLK